MVQINKIVEVENDDKMLKSLQKRRSISWKKAILSAIESFKDFKLDSVDQYKTIVPQKPMQHQHSVSYLEAIKQNDYHKVWLYLDSYPNLVYEFDNQYQTGLHWAAKRGHSKIVLLLIKSKANINYKDVLGRTPLWVACKYDRISCVKVLLANKANAFIKCHRKLSPQDASTDDKIWQLIEKGKMVQVIMRFIPKLRRKDLLNELGLSYFLKDLHQDVTDM